MKPVPMLPVKYKIPDRDVDPENKLKPSTLFAYFQDTAEMHSDNIGTGRNVFASRGVAWILMRVRVEIYRMPRIDEEITVQTWPQIGKALYDRDYRVLDEDGNVIAAGASIWVIMDIESRTIVKDAGKIYADIPYPEERALDKAPARIRIHDELTFIYEKIVRHSDTDKNKHLNNTKYVDIIIDTFSEDELAQFDITAIEVNYSNEAYVGEKIAISRIKTDSGYTFEGRTDDKQVFTAAIEVSPK
jgi:acyl-ACP thioesterase